MMRFAIDLRVKRKGAEYVGESRKKKPKGSSTGRVWCPKEQAKVENLPRLNTAISCSGKDMKDPAEENMLWPFLVS